MLSERSLGPQEEQNGANFDLGKKDAIGKGICIFQLEVCVRKETADYSLGFCIQESISTLVTHNFINPPSYIICKGL